MNFGTRPPTNEMKCFVVPIVLAALAHYCSTHIVMGYTYISSWVQVQDLSSPYRLKHYLLEKYQGPQKAFRADLSLQALRGNETEAKRRAHFALIGSI